MTKDLREIKCDNKKDLDLSNPKQGPVVGFLSTEMTNQVLQEPRNSFTS